MHATAQYGPDSPPRRGPFPNYFQQTCLYFDVVLFVLVVANTIIIIYQYLYTVGTIYHYTCVENAVKLKYCGNVIYPFFPVGSNFIRNSNT